MTPYSTLIQTMHLSCTIFELQQVICQKSPILPTPPAFGAPVGMTPFEFRQNLWQQITSPVLSCGFVCVTLSLAILTTYVISPQSNLRRVHRKGSIGSDDTVKFKQGTRRVLE